jgi:catalase
MCAASAMPPLELGKEYPPSGEQEAINRLRDITERTMVAKSHDPTVRDVHPKSHGYASASFTVHNDLPIALRAGIFTTPATYQAWIRFSNGSSDRTDDGKDFLPDTEGDVRGMAIKLTGVDGEFASPGFNHAGEQDFILMNSPRFFIKDVADYLVFFGFMRKFKEGVQTGSITLGPDGKPTSLPNELKPAYAQIK